MQHLNPYNDSIGILLLASLFLPLFSAVISIVISDRYSWVVSFLASLLMLGCTVTSALVTYQVWNADVYHVQWEWFNVGGHAFSSGFYLNKGAVLLLFLVSFISFLVHVYSTGYMATDKGIRKYFSVLGFFTSAMLALAVADNLLVIFFFWELVGFSSFLLIGHWNDRPAAAAAARKAFLFNRIGDAGFLIGLMIIWARTGSFDLEYLSRFPIDTWATIPSLCLFCGVIGKSAQFPLLTWLPDAMEGPTPVSALIHAATMVAAGIYLLVRVDFLFTPPALEVVAIVGIVTALMAACSALVQTDIKKILAYSTISQLGLMVTAVGAGHPEIALMHLFAHAFFKACLFLAAGSVIHTLHRSQQQSPEHFDVQDVRNLGGLRKRLPITFLAFVISGCSLAGVPFFSGFLSKDAIITAVYAGMENNAASLIFTSLVLIVSFLTAVYTFRLVWKVFFGKEKKTHAIAVAEAPAVMRAPMIILMIASSWLMISVNPFDYQGWLFSSLQSSQGSHFNFIIVFSALWVLLALWVAYKTREVNLDSNLLLKSFFLDNVYERVVNRSVLRLSQSVDYTDRKVIDPFLHASAYAQVTLASLTGWFDRIVVDGTVDMVGRIARGIGSFLRSFQGGKIQMYIFWALLTIIIFLIWTLF